MLTAAAAQTGDPDAFVVVCLIILFTIAFASLLGFLP